MGTSFTAPLTGLPTTAYFVVTDDQGRRWSVAGSAFETHTDGNWANYDTSLTRMGTSSSYVGVFPSSISAGVYQIELYEQGGVSPSLGDAVLGGLTVEWNGTAMTSPSDVVSADVVKLNASTPAAALLALLHSSAESGTAQAGASSTITLRSGASSVNDTFKDQSIWLTGGTGQSQTNRITAYNGTTKVATVATAWVTTPDNTTTYVVVGRIE